MAETEGVVGTGNGGPASAEQRDRAADKRDRAAVERDRAADRRDRSGEDRDRAAGERDLLGEGRDRAAEERDRAAEHSERTMGAANTPDAFGHSPSLGRAAASDRRGASEDRRAEATGRSESVNDRDTALADRASGASDRSEAVHDRDAALADREASATDRGDASVDGLTGVTNRGTGLVELAHEIARAKRTDQPLVLAFIDIDHLKIVNDLQGHAAGDRLLIEVAHTLRGALRSYDLTVRYGGDEFICVIAGLGLADATKRLAPVRGALAKGSEHGSVTIGLAELRPDDSSDTLIARADADLYEQRQQQ